MCLRGTALTASCAVLCTGSFSFFSYFFQCLLMAVQSMVEGKPRRY